MVFLSNADIPVVIFSLASIDTVKAVVFFPQLFGFIKGSFSFFTLSSEAMQGMQVAVLSGNIWAVVGFPGVSELEGCRAALPGTH